MARLRYTTSFAQAKRKQKHLICATSRRDGGRRIFAAGTGAVSCRRTGDVGTGRARQPTFQPVGNPVTDAADVA